MQPLLLLILLTSLAAIVGRLGTHLGPGERRWLWAGAALLALGLTYAIYPSDLHDWSFGQLVLYLSEPRLDPFALLGDLLTGGVMFGLFTYAIYRANRR